MFELLSAGYKTERGFMKKGEIYEGIIEKVEFPNKGFVWVDDQKVIVKNGIPGQKVRFMINKKRSGRAEGRLLEVLEKSPLETREPACQEFPACGGCMYPTKVERHALDFPLLETIVSSSQCPISNLFLTSLGL